MTNFVLNKSEPLVLIDSTQIQITIPLFTSNGTRTIGCLFEHHHFPGDRRFLHMCSSVAAWPGGEGGGGGGGGASTHPPLYDVGRQGHRRVPGGRRSLNFTVNVLSSASAQSIVIRHDSN